MLWGIAFPPCSFLCFAPFDEVEKIPQRLFDTPADCGALDTDLLDAPGSQEQAIDRPFDVAERFPEPHVRGIDRVAACLLICGEEIIARAETADRPRAAEAPGPDTEPSQVLHRIANLSQFPIEHAADALLADDKIAGAKIAVQHRDAMAARRVLGRPPERKFQRRQL